MHIDKDGIIMLDLKKIKNSYYDYSNIINIIKYIIYNVKN